MATKRTPRSIFIGVGMLIALAEGLLFAWSYWRTPLSELFPTWSSASLSTIFSLHHTAVSVSVVVTGLLSKWIGPRIRMAFGALLIGGSLFCYPFLPLDNPDLAYTWALILFCAAAVGVGFTSNTRTGTFVLWAPERPGLMAGCMLFLFGITSFLYGALSSLLIPKIGVLQTIRVCGIVSFVLIMAVLPFVRKPTEADHLPEAIQVKGNEHDRSFTPLQMLKSPIFWSIFLCNVMIRSAGFIFGDFNGSIALAFGVSALFGMLYSPANACAAFFAGFFTDKVGTAWTIRIYSIVLFVGCGLLFIANFTNIAILAIIGLICGGFAFGGTSAANAGAIRMYFGSEHFSQNFGISMLSIFCGSGFCILGGYLVDVMGGYLGVYVMCFFFGVLAFLSTVWMSVSIKKESKRIAAEDATKA